MIDETLLEVSLYNDSIPSIDLHGIVTLQDAQYHLEQELYTHSQSQALCRVIYGVGTGKAREMTLEVLLKNPLVRDFKEERAPGRCLVQF